MEALTCLFVSCSSGNVTETMTSATTSSLSDSSYVISDVISTPSLTVTLTPLPTSKSSTDFVYVEYDDYDEYSSYEDPSLLSERPGTIPHAGTATTTWRPRKTAPPHVFQRKTPKMPLVTVPMVTVTQTPAPLQMSSIPEFPTTSSADVDDIINATTSEGRSLRGKVPLTEPEPASSSIPLSKKENNSVDEVQYRIVGMVGDGVRVQQNYFVPRMPPLRERTQNKRIQQLLKEKRLQELLSRLNRTRAIRTD